MTKTIENRLEALSAEAKRLVLLKAREAIKLQSKNTPSRGNRIVAYIQGNKDLSIDQLKKNLKKKLPEYMVPSLYIPVEKIPLLPNGKIDQKRLQNLASPTAVHNNKKATVTPISNDTTKKLLKIWEETLGFSPIHQDDNFFELGGDSILSIQIVAKARKEGLVLQSNDLFKYQTIAELSNFTETSQVEESDTSIKEKLIGIWEETLGFSPIHQDDNFFELGGDSILSIQIVARAKKEGIDLASNALFKYQTITELSQVATMLIGQESEVSTKEKLISIWEETLGFAPIREDDNFFEIGGDSIVSIQIIAKARKMGINLMPNDLFKNQTIKELSLFAKANNTENTFETIVGPTPLLPIQQWFFEVHKNAPYYWNQGVRLDSIPVVSKEKVSQVCHELITQHDLLRARFKKKDGQWSQEIMTPEVMVTLEFFTIGGQDEQDISKRTDSYLKKIQDEFDLSKGSLFKCIYFKNENTSKDFCFLIAHHLVVDAVSWEIIVDDFVSALREIKNGVTRSKRSKSTSYKEWAAYICNKEITIIERNFWQSQIASTPKLPIDKEALQILEERDIVQESFTLGDTVTSNLIAGNKVLNTKTEELLITAFVTAIGNWSNQPKIAIGFERHGRETEDSGLDVSSTVGWFTSYFPILFDYAKNTEVDKKMISVKETMRSIPNGGIGYGVLKYNNPDFTQAMYPEIVFNFLGTRRNQVASSDSYQKEALTENLRDPRSERHYKLEFNVRIDNGVLQGELSYSNRVHNEDTIKSIVDDFKSNIMQICDYCKQSEKDRYTPSDFSDADISQNDLDNLLGILDS